ncbi:5-methylthioribose kinase [Algoriphagus boseongensis]|uniref:5-methylthioribose kinase n=1 Tax=Algoriphagus boseongensis TaxID=1442587 RepID=A0A4R6T803_9BACT|nr:phosphotransferase [Algoriphagus boseongensis]TDQ18821.1 5-methylthioribose kinase [Algoriphagus boseongensis]
MVDLSENTPIQEIKKLSFWETGEEILKIESAGPSNMNLVLRIQTDLRSVILKQSKNFVRKFPQIPAPIERINVEFEFLSLLGKEPKMESFIPEIIHFDPENHLLVTEDLGLGIDFSWIYTGEKSLKIEEIDQLTEFLNILHGLNPKSFPLNKEMRKLNHEHIFNFPFLEENGFDLDTIQEGLQEISLTFKKDKKLKEEVSKLGEDYMGSGDTLLHGDFYPGSWLQVSSGIKIIDPEFGFMGNKEFDLGVFLAHLDLGQQPESIKDQVLKTYSSPLNSKLLNQYRGVEILRRLIGIAQLPVKMTLGQKSALMNFAKELILS